MAAIENDIPSGDRLRGCKKNPTVVLKRLNVIPYLNKIWVKYDKNEKMVPYSVDQTQSCLIQKILRNCFVLVSKCPDINNVAKKNVPAGKARRKPKTGKCNRCNEMFNNNEMLREHIKLRHLKPNYICSFCSKKYVRKAYFERHILSHHEESVDIQRNSQVEVDHNGLDYASSLCTNQFDSNFEYRCNLCTETFETKADFLQHRAVHEARTMTIMNVQSKQETCFTSNNNSWGYHCKECRKYFSTDFALFRHVNINHTPLNLACLICKETFPTYSSLQSHTCPEATIPIIEAKLEEQEKQEDCTSNDDEGTVNTDFNPIITSIESKAFY